MKKTTTQAAMGERVAPLLGHSPLRNDLDTQIAQRLFGWTYAAMSYATDPAGTALVWQWLETHGPLLHGVHVTYAHDGEEGPYLRCMIAYGRKDCSGYGATWPEALCRAALALAEALEGARHA